MAPGGPEHLKGHQDAEALAWHHVEQVLSRGDNATHVDSRFGAGELRGEGRFRHHGDPHKEFGFFTHPRKPDFHKTGQTVWRPGRDTLHAAPEF